MAIGIALVLALIIVAVFWNLKRAGHAWDDICSRNAQHDHMEAAAAELGRVRDRVRELRARYQKAAAEGTLRGDAHIGVSAWRVADEYVADSARCVKRMDFFGALAEMNRAFTTANDYMREFATR